MGESVIPAGMDFSFLIGAWEVIDCGLETAKGDGQGVVGAIFELTADGEVIWKLPENHIDIPVFSSETYEAVARGPFLTTLIRFGSFKGHVIEFRIEKFNAETQTMTIHEGLLYLNCKKLTGNFPNDSMMETPYSLLPAFEEGYFTDLTITASDNTVFEVHTCILKILAPNVDWRAEPTPLSGLPSRIISSIIHYMYTYSLPSDLTLEAADELIVASSNIPGLEDLGHLCKTFIKNVNLARDMASLISDVHSLGIQATDHFAIRSDLHSIKEPPILCSAVRNAIRDVAVALSKIMLFCDTYNKRKAEFSQKGIHEIIRFTRSRIPFFVSQVTTFMQVVKATFGSLTASERHELACYLIPDMAYIFDTVITVLLRTQEFFETVLLNLGPEDNAKYRLKMHNFNEHMKRINHKKEVSKIRFVLHRIECLVHHLKKKRDRFRNLNSDNKVRSLTRNLDHLIDRLPFLFLRLEEMTEDLEQKCEWIESQFCFKITTAKVGEFLTTLLENKEALQTLLSTLCDVVQRDDFTQSVISLGILDYPVSNDFINFGVGAADDTFAEEHGFNLAQFLWEPPPPRLNTLCRNALQRLIDSVETDMVFRIIPTDVVDYEDDYGDTDIGDFTDDEGDSVNGQGQAIVSVDAKVEDASTAPVGAEDASSTDRGSDSEATASTETEGACLNSTEPEGACPNRTQAEDTSSNLGENGATTKGTTTDDGVSTEKHTDGATEKSRSTEDEVPAGKSDGATHAEKGKEDEISSDKQTDGARREASKADDEIPVGGTDGARSGASKADDEIPVGGTDGAVRPKRYEEGAISKDKQTDGARRGGRKADDEIPVGGTDGARSGASKADGEIPVGGTDGAVRPKRYGDERSTSDEEIGGVRRRTRKPETKIPAHRTDSSVRPKRYGGKGSSSEEEIGGVKRRTRKPETEIPALKTDSAVRPKRYGEGGSTSDEEIGGVRRRTRKPEDEIPRSKADSSARPRRYGGGSSDDEEIGGVRRRTRKTETKIPVHRTDSAIRPRRYGEGGISDDEEIGGVRRRTRRPEDEIPAIKTDSALRQRRHGDEGSTSDEEIGGVRRRTRKPEDDFPRARTDSAARPKRDKEDTSSTGHQIGGARRRAGRAEDKISAVGTGSVARQEQGKIGADSAKKEVGDAACAIAEGAGSVEREEKEEVEEGAAWAIKKGERRVEREEKGAARASAEGAASSSERDKEDEEGAACAIAGVSSIKGEKEEKGLESAFIRESCEGIMTRRFDGGEEEKIEEIITVKAHRAIIATRCPLFKKALLSGMLEDINRMIDLHNISPKLFPLFLNYLYTGIIDYPSLTPRQIMELFLIADCYELFSFKEGCERALKMYIDDNSVLLFFHMAEKYMAPILKDACRKYIREHPTISLDNELYDELPRHLKSEIYDLIAWGKDRVLLINGQDQDQDQDQDHDRDRDQDGSDVAGACALADGDSDTETAQGSRSYDWTGRMYWSKAVAIGRSGVRDLNIIAPQPMQYQPSMFLESISGERELIVWINLPRWNIPRVDIEDCVPSTDSIRFRWALEQLRDIVGPGVPRTTLVQVLLAADCDLNRALNYYYSSS